MTIDSSLGSLEEQEFFGEVLLGIKQVIQTHMKEIQVKFQDKFFNLELEVKKRDDIISKLQNRIQELEHHDPQQLPEGDDGALRSMQTQQKQGSSGSGTSRSSDELPFMVSKCDVIYVLLNLNFDFSQTIAGRFAGYDICFITTLGLGQPSQPEGQPKPKTSKFTSAPASAKSTS